MDGPQPQGAVATLAASKGRRVHDDVRHALWHAILRQHHADQRRAGTRPREACRQPHAHTAGPEAGRAVA
eukprot:3634370-Prymnesium_polylepis.1